MIVIDNPFTITIINTMTTRSNTISAAAYMLGVSEDTVEAWMASHDRIIQLELENNKLKTIIENEHQERIKIQEAINKVFEDRAKV